MDVPRHRTLWRRHNRVIIITITIIDCGVINSGSVDCGVEAGSLGGFFGFVCVVVEFGFLGRMPAIITMMR